MHNSPLGPLTQKSRLISRFVFRTFRNVINGPSRKKARFLPGAASNSADPHHVDRLRGSMQRLRPLGGNVVAPRGRRRLTAVAGKLSA